MFIEDPFEDLDSLDSNELKDLINQIAPTDAECSVDQYIDGDNDIPVCFEHENEKLEEQFLHALSPQNLYPLLVQRWKILKIWSLTSSYLLQSSRTLVRPSIPLKM